LTSTVDEAAADPAVIDRLFEAIARGDVATARACCAPDAVFWHSFDARAASLEEASATWAELAASFEERAFIDVRRQPLADGYVQRHLMVLRAPEGVRMGWAICLFATLRGGLISRIDEYLDRAGMVMDAAAG
jgi:ketosteroid isomerase-like protein